MIQLPRNRPLWRWWQCCIALDLWWRLHWQWLADLFGWAVLPEWLGAENEGEV